MTTIVKAKAGEFSPPAYYKFKMAFEMAGRFASFWRLSAFGGLFQKKED